MYIKLAIHLSRFMVHHIYSIIRDQNWVTNILIPSISLRHLPPAHWLFQIATPPGVRENYLNNYNKMTLKELPESLVSSAYLRHFVGLFFIGPQKAKPYVSAEYLQVFRRIMLSNFFLYKGLYESRRIEYYDRR